MIIRHIRGKTGVMYTMSVHQPTGEITVRIEGTMALVYYKNIDELHAILAHEQRVAGEETKQKSLQKISKAKRTPYPPRKETD